MIKRLFLNRRLVVSVLILCIGLSYAALAKDYTTTFAEGVSVVYAVNTTDKIARVKKVTDSGKNAAKSVTVPKTVKYKSGATTYTLTVTKIGEEAFSGTKIESISLPSTIESIGDMAFASGKLKSINLPKSLRTIGAGAFTGNSIASITIPASCVKIGNNAFCNAGIENLSFAEGGDPLAIGNSAFAGNRMKSVTIPVRVNSLGSRAFMSCEQMTSLTMLACLTATPLEMCSHCFNLTGISLPSSVSHIADRSFYQCNLRDVILLPGLVSVGDQAFEYCSLTSMVLPEGVQTIGKRAFLGNSDMVTLSLPSTLRTVGDEAFLGLVGLKYVESNAMIPPALPSPGFERTTYLDTGLSVPAQALIAYIFHHEWKNFNYDPYLTEGTEPLKIDFENKYKVTLMREEYYDIKATVKPATALDKTIIWTSSDPSVVSVDKNGRATAQSGIGTATITATCGKATATTDIEVIPAKVYGLSLMQPWGEDDILKVGENLQLSVSIKPKCLQDVTPVSWTSSDSSVLTVSSNGLISGISPGTATINVRAGTLELNSDYTVIQGDGGVNDIDSDKTSVSVNGNTVTINNPGDSSAVSLYSLGGIEIAGQHNGYTSVFENLAPGIYIVRFSGHAQKIIVR